MTRQRWTAPGQRSRREPARRLAGAVRRPVHQPAETAQKILAAASTLLTKRGYEAVTLENVAREAGVNKASIRYNFGNKAGLMTAIVDGLIHDECLRMAADLDTVDQDDRWPRRWRASAA